MFAFKARPRRASRTVSVDGTISTPRPAAAGAGAEALESRRLLSGLAAYPVYDFTGVTGADAPRTALNGLAFVVGGGQRALFQSDGTTPGTSSIAPSVSSLFDWGGTLYFNSNLPSSGLFKLEPGSSTPVEIRDPNGIQLSNAHAFVPIGDKLYFAAGGSDNVYVTDGTSAGTRLIHFGTPLGRAGDLLIFRSFTQSPPNTQSLWRTDGTAAGTVTIKDNFDTASWPSQDLGPVLLFAGPAGLWKTDGTSDGTVLVKQNLNTIVEWERVGDALYGMAAGTSFAGTLWKTDGTAAGTVSVDSINAGTGLNPAIGPSMVHVADTLYYVRGTSGGPQLFATQGPGTSRQVTFIGSGVNFAGVLPALAVVSDKILFPARSSGNAYELWESGGIFGDATKVQGLPAVGNSSDGGPLNLLPVGGSLFFTQATLNSPNSRLWRYGVVTAALDDNGVLVVSGTDPAEGVSGNDTIALTVNGDNVTATVNGTPNSFPLAGVRQIAVDGFGGDDTLAATGLTAIPLMFNGGTGQDTLSVVGTSGDDTVVVTSFPTQGAVGTVHTSAVESLTIDALGGDDVVTFVNLRGPATFHGGDGDDIVRLDDRDRVNDEDYVLTGTAFGRSAAPGGATATLLTFDGAEAVALRASDWTNVVKVTPSDAVRFDVDGGDPPAGRLQRDRLTVDANGATGTHHESGASAGSGLWTFTNRRPVSYVAVEQTDDGSPVTADIVDVAPDPRKVSVADVRIVFSEAVAGLDLADLHLTRAGSPDNLLTPQQTLTSDDGGVTWTLGNLADLTGANGVYTVSLAAAGSGVTDLVGSPLATDASDSFAVDTVAPTVDVEDVSPDPRTSPVDFVRIVFSEPVVGLLPSYFSLNRSGGPNLLTDAQTLTQLDARTYAINNLTPLTRQAGTYFFNVNNSTLASPLLSITDAAGNKLATGATDTWQTRAQVQGRYVFYNGSLADGGDLAADERDDAAIARDKQVLLPGQPATFANYTSYGRGINGVMIDIAGLPTTSLTAQAFQFLAGNTDNTSDWRVRPTPSAIAVRPGAGVNGSDRVTITWPDAAIRNKWLWVQVRATPATGLQADDVFYVGNLAGETGNFPAGVGARVDPGDYNATKNQQLMTGLPLSSRWDHNRDGRVNTADLAIVKRNLGAALKLFTPPLPATAAATSRPGGKPAPRTTFGPAGAGASVAAVNPGSNPTGFFNLGGTIFFAADDGVHGSELWKTDGTPEGTMMVADINPGRAASSPRRFSAVGGTLVFAADDGSHGLELWRSDGTAAGTTLLEDINPGPDSSVPGTGGTSDGTGTRLVVGNVLYFCAIRPEEGLELWRTDGTPYGTYLVRDLDPGPGGPTPAYMVELDGKLFFAPNNGGPIWRSSGTAFGTVRVPGAISGGPFTLTSSGGYVYYRPPDQPGQNLLRKTDGVTTSVVADLGGAMFFPADVGGTLYMQVTPSNGLSRLYRSDGTAASTGPVGDATGPNAPLGAEQITAVAGVAYFVSRNAVQGSEVWRSDGTAVGTHVVKDIQPGAAQSFPMALTAIDGMLYFTARDPVAGRQIWRSDGTEAGTVRLTNASGGMPDTATFAKRGDFVYFAANDGATGLELWRTDGTEAGTMLVKDINPGTPAPPAVSAVSIQVAGAAAQDAARPPGTSVARPAFTPSRTQAPGDSTSPRRRGAFDSLNDTDDILP